MTWKANGKPIQGERKPPDFAMFSPSRARACGLAAKRTEQPGREIYKAAQDAAAPV